MPTIPAPPGQTEPEPGRSGWVDAQVELLAAAWRRGERVTVDDVLARHPELDDEAAVRLIYEEVCLRREAGLEVATSEVVRKYPQFQADLEPLLGFDRLMRPGSVSQVEYPEPGESLGDFRLLDELGRGAAGRTFLAVQPSLADRPVVLKVTGGEHEEHLSLARLQHTHIVPLYSEQVFPDLGLRCLCMPFLGGASLAAILDELGSIPVEKRRGRDVLDALDSRSMASKEGAALTATRPYRQFLAQSSYVQACSFIAACLADALHYAHERGLVHMDVKPSNVLIAADGQPMLLDFHLAVAPLHPGGEHPVRLGGTPGWTSPEQDAAIRALSEGREIMRSVDGRSDVYSLGLLLDSMLGGIPAPAKRPLEQRNPRVTTGLGDIVRNCLVMEPSGRYSTAAELADDLRRYLQEMPLKGVPNRSLTERWNKWRKRRPDALARGAARLVAIVALLTAAGLLWAWHRQGVRQLETALSDARRFQEARRYEEAAGSVARGESVSLRRLAPASLLQALKAQKRLADLGMRADELHTLAEKVRFKVGSLPSAGDDLGSEADAIRRLWDARDWLTGDHTEGLDRKTRTQVEHDLVELALVWANLRTLAPADGSMEAAREALGVLDTAAAEFGDRPALTRERDALSATLGLPRPDNAGPRERMRAWEHDDLGRSYLRSGDIPRAAREFREAVDLSPADFWPNFYQGLCAYRLGRFEDALACFRTCIALAPRSAECRVNRALAYERLGREAEAYQDYSRAIEIDRSLVEALLNRGILSFRAGRLDEAKADFRETIRANTSRENEARARYNLALCHRKAGDITAAREEARKAVALGSVEARNLLGQ